MSKIIDGNVIAKTIREELIEEVKLMNALHGKVPGLAVVLVGMF